MSTITRDVLRLAALRILARRAGPMQGSSSFPEFLSTLTVEDPHRGTVPFEGWPHLVARAEAWERGEHEVVLKSRQVGMTWLAAGFAAYRALQPAAVVLYLSAGQRESYAALARVRSLLMGAGVALSVDNAGEIAVAGGGRVVALPSTRDAGRGYTASLVIVDEGAFHPWAAENYQAYRPTMADGGQLIIVSTANGSGDWFHRTYEGAERGELPLKAVFIPWSVRPGRDAAWLVRERSAYSGTAAEFSREYPATAEEAFTAHSGLVYGYDADGELVFDRNRNVCPPEVAWKDCKWRIVGYDPGGRDPAGLVAVGIYPALPVKQPAVVANVRGMWRHHVYGEWRTDGPISAFDVRDYVHRLGGVTRVYVGETGGSTVAETLQAMGLPAYQAPLAKRDGVGHVRWLLKSGLLTVSPRCALVQEEFGQYWVKPARDRETSADTFPTMTPANHHADLLDALRYACLGVLLALPQRRLTIERVGRSSLRFERAGRQP